MNKPVTKMAMVAALVWLTNRVAQSDEPGTESGSNTVSMTTVPVPALTPVSLTIEEPMSSNKNKSGDHFGIIVAEDVIVDGKVAIPAGTPGEGEVVHAAKSSFGGKAGEMILAARFLSVGDQHVPLRSFSAQGTGKDRTGTAIGVTIATGVFGLLVSGGELIIAKDTRGMAKIAQDVSVPVLPAKNEATLDESQPQVENKTGESR